MTPFDLSDIRNIAISGRIGAGATTLAKNLAGVLGWDVLDGGKLMRKTQAELGAAVEDALKRPDHFDLEYEERVKKMFRDESHHIIQSHFAGFDAQGIEGVFKILVVCEDAKGQDKKEVRVDRLVNRDGTGVVQAKHEMVERDRQDLEKWRKLYANNDQSWVYWDKKYYDLVINTYSHNQDETLKLALEKIGYK
jgi:cytidylate kinase